VHTFFNSQSVAKTL